MSLSKMLRLNIQFFSAEGGTGGAGEGGSPEGGTPDATDKTGDSGDTDTSWIDELYAPEPDGDESDKDQMIPKKRFDSVNTKYKGLADSNKTLSDTHEKLQSDFKALEVEHGVAAGRVTSLEGVITKMVDAEMEQIDETYHDLIPQDKTVEEKLDWILKAKQKGMFGIGQGSYEYEIGGMSNPGGANRSGRNTSGMNPLQLMTMGYGSK